MALSLYANGSIKITGTDAFTLDNLENCSFDPKTNIQTLASAGNSRSSFVYTLDSMPHFTATVKDLGTLFGKIGIGGLSIGDTAHATVECYWTKKLLAGETTSGSAHFKTVFSKALIVIRSVNVQQGQVATADIEVIAYSSDGTTDPMTQTDSVSITCAVADEVFTLGPILIPTQDDNVTGFTIDTGIEIDSVISGGAVYPVWVGIKSIKPKITLKTKNVTMLNSLGSDGAALGDDWVLWARKCENTGTRVADGTAEHISFTVHDTLGMVSCGAFSAGGDRADAEGELMITPIVDCSTTDLFTIDASAAIS